MKKEGECTVSSAYLPKIQDISKALRQNVNNNTKCIQAACVPVKMKINKLTPTLNRYLLVI